MPNRVVRKVSGKTTVENQIKKPERGVYSRPTDPFEQPFESDQTAQVLSSLQKVLQTGLEAAVPFAERARERGVLDAQADEVGKTKSTIFASAYEAGVDQVYGESNANEFAREASAVAIANREKGMDVVHGEIKRLQAKYLAANTSDSAAKAFLPKATVISEKLLNKQKEYEIGEARKALDEKTYDNQNEFFRNDAINGVLEEYGLSVDSLLTEEGLDIWDANRQEIMDKLGPVLGAGNTAFQQKYAGVHSKSKISTNTVQILTGLAITTGRKEFLKFAYDQQGGEDMPLSSRFDEQGNPFGKTLDAASIRADERDESLRKELRIRREQREQKEANAVGKEITNKIRQAYKSEEYPTLLAEQEDEIIRYAQMPGADKGELSSLWVLLDTAKNRRHHPAASDITVRENLAFMYARNSLTVPAVTAQRWKLSPGDFEKLLGQAQEQEEQKTKRKETGTDAYFTNRNNVHIAYDSYFQSHNPKNRITGLPFDFGGEAKAVDARREFQRRVVLWQDEHGGQSPDKEALDLIMQEIEKDERFKPYKRLLPTQIEGVRQQMIKAKRWPKDLQALQNMWGSLTSVEREAASHYIGN